MKNKNVPLILFFLFGAGVSGRVEESAPHENLRMFCAAPLKSAFVCLHHVRGLSFDPVIIIVSRRSASLPQLFEWWFLSDWFPPGQL